MFGDGNLALHINTIVTKPGDLGSVTGTHLVEEQNGPTPIETFTINICGWLIEISCLMDIFFMSRKQTLNSFL